MIDRADPRHFYISTQVCVCTANVTVYTPKSVFFYCMLISVCTNEQKCICVWLRALSSVDVGGCIQCRNHRRYETTMFCCFFLVQPIEMRCSNTSLFYHFNFQVSHYKTKYLLRYELCCHGCTLCLPLYPAADLKSHKWNLRLLWHSACATKAMFVYCQIFGCCQVLEDGAIVAHILPFQHKNNIKSAGFCCWSDAFWKNTLFKPSVLMPVILIAELNAGKRKL